LITPAVSLFRHLSFVCLVLALAAVLGLLVLDVRHGFRLTEGHQKTGALALILIGTSYILVHAGGAAGRGTRLRAIFLGAAFALWGAEQFMPGGAASTVIDSAVIGIFVVDLSFSVARRLKRPDQQDD